MARCDKRKEIVDQLKSLLDELVQAQPPKPCPVPCCFQVKSDPKKPSPDVMVCYKCKPDSNKPPVEKPKTEECPELKPNRKKPETCQSRELLGGVLYVGCDCCKRNGLQDDCRRTQCQGSPKCVTKPDPICCPSQFSNGKHLMKKVLLHESLKRNAIPSYNTGRSSGVAEKNETLVENYLCYPAVAQCCDCD